MRSTETADRASIHPLEITRAIRWKPRAKIGAAPWVYGIAHRVLYRITPSRRRRCIGLLHPAWIFQLFAEEARTLIHATEVHHEHEGILYDGWKPAAEPTNLRTREEFLQQVSERMADAKPEADPERAARAVFALLVQKVSSGQIDQVKHVLPEEIGSLWPDPAAAST